VNLGKHFDVGPGAQETELAFDANEYNCVQIGNSPGN